MNAAVPNAMTPSKARTAVLSRTDPTAAPGAIRKTQASITRDRAEAGRSPDRARRPESVPPSRFPASAARNGRALSKSYRETRLKLVAWLARADQLEPEVAARESFLLGDKAIHQLVFDPLLPEPLVDVKERRAFVDAVLRYDRAGHAIWQRLHFNFLEAAAASRAARAH